MREFFAADRDRPFGVIAAAVAGVCCGSLAVAVGLLAMLAGVAGAKFVWWGLVFVAIGALLFGLNRPLRAGRPGARVLASALYAGWVVALFIVEGDTGSAGSPAPIIFAIVGVGVLAALWLVPSSTTRFSQPNPTPARRSTGGVAGWATLGVATVVFAAIGFRAASSTPGLAGNESSYAVPTAGVSTNPQQMSADGASSEVTQVLQQSEGATPTILTCSGTSLSTDPVADYSIGQVSEQTTGTFLVSADVTLTDGSTEVVSYLVGTDTANAPCIESSQDSPQTPASAIASASAPVVPADVPSLPAAGDPVPTDSPLPSSPQVPGVVAYTDTGTTPTTTGQLVEYQTGGLTGDQPAAVQDVIAFMTAINQQNFPAAWNGSTERLGSAAPSTQFTTGYATTRFYQVAFGQPSQLAADLIAIPARFVSRQNPAAQGNPAGTTDCTYWPQYVFLVVRHSSCRRSRRRKCRRGSADSSAW